MSCPSYSWAAPDSSACWPGVVLASVNISVTAPALPTLQEACLYIYSVGFTLRDADGASIQYLVRGVQG